MISEVFSKAYDGNGRAIFRPSKRRYGKFAPNAPMGRHVTQPLSVDCHDLDDIRRFLQTCRYMSDQAQFGRVDYWMPPEEFERRRRGDCDDFALWTWRQLMRLGYSARFVCGHGGRYGAGHAWVTFEREGRTFIVEALAAPYGPTFPRLSTLRYRPRISVTWDGRVLKYFKHTQPVAQVSFVDVAPQIPEWVAFWLRSRPRAWMNRLHRFRRLEAV
jgi:Bacterial transglutaminase-like cysteine proteinase BTLCP